MPRSEAPLTTVTVLDVSISALDGTQSVSTHEPPSPSRSASVTWAPSCAATSAASYPPGPPPMIATRMLRVCLTEQESREPDLGAVAQHGFRGIQGGRPTGRPRTHVVPEGVEGGGRQHVDTHADGPFVHVEAGLVDVQLVRGPRGAHPEPGVGTGHRLQVPGEVLAPQA